MSNQDSLVSAKNNFSQAAKSAAEQLYQHHASDETVPQGQLKTDLSLRQLKRAMQIMFAKNTLPRKKLPIRLDLTEFRSADFQYDRSSTQQVADRLKPLPLSGDGMKWIYHYDGELCVQFYGVRHVDINYDDLVRKIEISRVGDCFRDVIGINTEVLKRDGLGRPVLQIERIAALAQPAYSAFLGKDELDVYKLEFQEYHQDQVINWMRTVCSPNASTVADDSYLSLSRLPDGKTKIEFVALQQFPLPRIMVFLGFSRWKWFRELLTRFAYKAFWYTTSDNILARYYGKDFEIGCAKAKK
ncbi:hypothetical protein [Rheinheimera sp.]|uniref:hypothetical protein n=1 Tax=Rheinheimera sp. TaxID=1869214 RepID=UPI0027BA03FD|nr:hypothetical protein [Rheinheimera sp.]